VRPEHPDLGEGLADLVELERLHDGFDLLHGSLPRPWAGIPRL
jgi:hypothetical protein